jgi:hypothetical protein
LRLGKIYEKIANYNGFKSISRNNRSNDGIYIDALFCLTILKAKETYPIQKKKRE